MKASNIISLITRSPKYAELLSRLKELKDASLPLPLLVDGISEGAQPSLIYSLVKDIREEQNEPVLVLVSEERRANKLNELFKSAGLKSEFFGARDFNFYDITASHELEHERLCVLSGIVSSTLDVVFATPESALGYTMPRGELISRSININMNTPLEISSFARTLYSLGYTQCDSVEGQGQFAVRGGIIDIFPTMCECQIGKRRLPLEKPIRIELFGDEIDRLVTFDIESQRMLEKIDGFTLSPSREIIASEEKRKKIKEEIEALLSKKCDEKTESELKRELASLTTNDSSYTFFDKFISLIYENCECLLDYFSKNATTIICDSSSVSARARDFKGVENEIAKKLIEARLLPAKYAFFSAPVSKIDSFISERVIISIDTFITSRYEKQGGIYSFNTKGISLPNSSLASAIEELRYFKDNDYEAVLVTQNEQEAKSTIALLNKEEIPAFRLNEISELKRGAVGVICDSYPVGFELPLSKLALVVLSSRAYHEKHTREQKKLKNKSAGEKILSYQDLNVCDYVVHVNYGIGKFLGIQNLYVMGAHRDYIAIQYQGTDKLYLPVDQLDMVSRYIGSSSLGGEVRLSKMGGSEWKKSTTRAKASAKDMAKELIDLYARRTRLGGFAFLPDDIMEMEFDSSFEYEETDSQLLAIKEIKEDMEKPYPMDRVLCGDVGYGKTEVAFRAAMKAVANNKQVAILVPTTILAMQHFSTALSRFAGTGVNIEMLSRFRSNKEQTSILKRLKKGELDIIIGTHKLLSGKVEFKDLGLLIVDEEQRFGVVQKEKIKKAFPCVDVLTLSATPIPRTLSMAMGGIRDLSVLDESPKGRVGVQSYVLEHDENIINDAILRELHRGGQVFYLYNNVEHIYSIASKLKTAFPEARVAVGHGQMEREELEEIWQRLVSGELDILVSTTIIETGIDIPNANTLIIENADKMGLSQLHQIRGRVGRSHRRAYAFFTYRRGKELSDVASKRLSAIRDFAEFGAGFKIAMRDLEIRGAGNLLGAEQHGHLDAVGYDLFIRLLNEAVLEEKGEVAPTQFETKIIVSNDAFLPKNYVSSSKTRMELYKKIAHIENEDDLAQIESELTDRFGKMPPEAKMLTSVSIIKAYASRARIKKVEQLKGEIRLFPETVSLPLLVEISQLDKENILVCGVNKIPYISVKYHEGEKIHERAVFTLKHCIDANDCVKIN